MAQKDLHSLTKSTTAFSFSQFSTNETKNGIGFNTTGVESIEFIMGSGVITVPEFVLTMTLQDSDTDSGYVDVPAEFVLGTPAFINEANDEVNGTGTAKLGYIGKKRFVRCQITGTGAGGSEGTFHMGAVVVADSAHHIPFIPVPSP